MNVEAALGELKGILEPALSEIISIAVLPPESNPYFIRLPEANTVDFTIEEVASLVSRASNIFSSAARYAGIARANAKLAKGAYDRKYKRSKFGNNDAERERNAIGACEQEHQVLMLAESVVELAEMLESSARIASESARKLLDKVFNVYSGERRGEAGAYRDQDFTKF